MTNPLLPGDQTGQQLPPVTDLRTQQVIIAHIIANAQL
jgi:hypothetical protein